MSYEDLLCTHCQYEENDERRAKESFNAIYLRAIVEFVIIFHVFLHRYDDSNGVAIFQQNCLKTI